jgi:hypothetical protein
MQINQVACWQKHKDWRVSRAISFDEIKLSKEQKNSIKKGDSITKGNWSFRPIISENCGYCNGGNVMIIENYDEQEALAYAEHLRHKN